MKYLTKKQVIYLHKQLIQEFGGMEGIRNEEVFWNLLSLHHFKRFH